VSVRKHGNGWQVRVPGMTAVTVPRKRDADRLEIDMKTRKALGHLHMADPVGFGVVLDELLERKRTVGGKRGKLRPRSIEWYEASTAPWAPLRDVLVPSLRRKQVEDHIVKRAATAPVAARNELQVAKQALKVAESRGQMVDKAIFDIDPVSHETAEGQALTVDELNALAAWHPERVKRMILFVGTVGLRFTEAVNMRASWVDLDGGTVLIPRDFNKSRRQKRIPLAASEVALLREQFALVPGPVVFPTVKGAVYTKSGFRSVWVPARIAAGLPSFKFHWLRHTAISLMAQAGMAPEVIAERVGHSDGGALIYRRYRHLFPSELAKAVSLVDGLLSAASDAADGHRKDKDDARS